MATINNILNGDSGLVARNKINNNDNALNNELASKYGDIANIVSDLEALTGTNRLSATAIKDLITYIDTLLGSSDWQLGGNPPDSTVQITSSPFTVFSNVTNQKEYNEANAIAILNARTTGIRFGGRASVDGGLGVGTTVSVTAGAGQILNNTNAENPTYQSISFTAKSGLSLNTTNPNITYWYVDDNSDTIKQTTTAPSISDRKTRLYLFRTSFTGGVITGIAPEITTIQQEGANIRELAEVLGEIKIQGLQPAFSGANLKIKITSGTSYDYSSNYALSYVDTNTKTFATFDTAITGVVRYVTSSGVIATDRTDYRVGFYQVGGVETAIPGANTRVGLHFVWRFPATGNVRISYGRNFYTSVAEATTALASLDPYLGVPASFESALLLGVMIAPKNATDLSTQGTFVSTNKFGLFGGGLFVAGGSFLEKANNLSDLASIPTARTNLDVYSKAEAVSKVEYALTLKTGTVVEFNNAAAYGYVTAETGNITFDFTTKPAVSGVSVLMRHNSGTKPTMPANVKKLSGDYVLSVDNHIYFVPIRTATSPDVWEVHVTVSQDSNW